MKEASSSPKGRPPRSSPSYNLTPSITVETPDSLYVRGSVLKTLLGDKTSPVLYGYDQNALAVYFNQAPVMRVGGGSAAAAAAAAARTCLRWATCSRTWRTPTLTTLDGPPPAPVPATPGVVGGRGRGGRGTPPILSPETAAPGGGRGGGRGGSGGADPDAISPRVLLSFPTNANDLLLSGILIGGEALAGRAVAIDAPIGKGHVVMFANRPFWRWQTQGNFFLGLQRDPELERSRRGPDTRADGADAGGAITGDLWLPPSGGRATHGGRN